MVCPSLIYDARRKATEGSFKMGVLADWVNPNEFQIERHRFCIQHPSSSSGRWLLLLRTVFGWSVALLFEYSDRNEVWSGEEPCTSKRLSSMGSSRTPNELQLKGKKNAGCMSNVSRPWYTRSLTTLVLPTDFTPTSMLSQGWTGLGNLIFWTLSASSWGLPTWAKSELGISQN